MPIESGNINEGDTQMAIAKEPIKNSNSPHIDEHKTKVTKAIKEITNQHTKLLKKLAEQSMIELLDLDDVLLIHKEATEAFGGSHEFYHDTLAKVHSILDQQNPHFGYDKYPSVFDKAAMLWYFFHKRTLLC